MSVGSQMKKILANLKIDQYYAAEKLGGIAASLKSMAKTDAVNQMPRISKISVKYLAQHLMLFLRMSSQQFLR